MKRSPRHIIAGMLTVMYMAIAITPLAPLAMRSATVAHAVTGECSGDCDICGCSPERRANHTCCCYMKKRMQQHKEEAEHAANRAGNRDETSRKGGLEQLPECCRKMHAQKKVATLRCNCPCGKGKPTAFWGTERYELIPYRFAEEIPPPQEELHHHSSPQRLTSRHGEPPDPPPRLFLPA